jgi:hypothetical protein
MTKIMQMVMLECCGIDAFKKSIGDDSSVICLNAPQTTHVSHTV